MANGRANIVGAVCLVVGLCAMALPATAGALVYWSNYTGNTIGRSNLDGTAPNQTFITGATRPRAVALDGQHVYWANYNSGTIGRSNLDGSAPDQSFITGAGYPAGLAVDSQHIYWTNGTDPGTIGRAALDGNVASVNGSFITGAAAPEGVAVDAQHVYWANYSTGTIGRADLDGNAASVNQSFITGGDHPTGVAVDTQHVYWPNSNTTTIGRANLDGNAASVNQSFITGVAAVGMAVDADHVYWANAGTGIARANLNGSGTELSFVAGTDGDPTEVAVDSTARTGPAAASHRLTIAKTGRGNGTVTSADGQINCGTRCSHSYVAGTVVTLRARTAAGSRFVGWSGGGCSGTGSCTVRMSSDQIATARYDRQPPNTRLGKARISSGRAAAKFRFKARGGATGFQCALAKRGHRLKFKRCKSPATYKALKPGRYIFEVRSVGPGGRDPTPAKKKFTLH